MFDVFLFNHVAMLRIVFDFSVSVRHINLLFLLFGKFIQKQKEAGNPASFVFLCQRVMSFEV